MRDTLVLLTRAEDHEELHRRIFSAPELEARSHFRYVLVGECALGVDATGEVVAEYDDGELAFIQ